MKYLHLLGAAAAALSLTALPADAQDVSFEGRGALTFPTGDFGDAAEEGAAFGGDVFVNLNPNVSVYGGYQYEMFDCVGCSGDGFTASGFEAGAKFLLDRESGVLPWARVGAVLNKLDFEEGSFEAESDRSVGLQASVGVDIPLGETISFSPAVRYQAWTVDFETLGGSIAAEQAVRSFSLDFGIHVHPGA
ncbi:MAG TPA: outer membrane beta-barrel protein [Longimicrobiales bacterium]|nr:outer membrane beta-barrel protein [Longimicrobiales bacterium]